MKKRLGVWLLVLMILTNSLPAAVLGASDAELKKAQQEQKKIKDQLNQVNKNKKLNESKQKNIVKTINGIEGQIDTLENQVNNLGNDIVRAEQDIGAKSVELKIAENNIVNKKGTLNSRLRVMYKTGSVGYIEVLLGSNDFEDLMTRIDTVRKIFLHDTEMIKFLVDQRNIIEKTKKDLQVYKDRLKQKVDEKEAAQANLNVKVSELGVAKQQLAADHKALEAQEDSLKAEADKITKILASMKVTQKYVGGVMSWPVPASTKITSPFGYRIHPILKTKKLHTGIDIGVGSNNSVIAAQAGTVIHSGWLGGYGKALIIDHGGGIATLYAHNNTLLVGVGEKVTRGQGIAKSGSTGLSTGPHVHFEVRVNGQYVDPMKYVSP